MQLLVLPSGSIRCVYDEAIDLSLLGTRVVVRASHVEPDLDGSWYADLSPVGGPRLGPFGLRTEGIVAERRWLEAHWLIGSAQ